MNKQKLDERLSSHWLSQYTANTGRPPPSSDTVDRARAWLVASGATQHHLVTVGVDGEIVLDWWAGEKSLTVYVDATALEYFKIWGSSVHEMEYGPVEEKGPELWKWLLNEQGDRPPGVE